MQKLKYYLAATCFTLVMLVGGAGLAYASTNVDGSNDTTGPNSDNQNEWDIHNDVHVDLANSANADNWFCVDPNTGKNDIGNNTQVDDVSTGDIWGTVDVSNDLNSADISIADLTAGQGNIDVSLANSITGPNSENENKVDIHSDSHIDISNEVNIDNGIKVDANTGKNEVDHNTVVGDIETGSIRIDSTTNNTANQNAGSVDLSGLGGSNVTANFSNDTTGPYSSNENTLDVKGDLNVDVNNTANIENNTTIKANTGDNSVDHNTVVGDISTGSIRIDVSTTNTAN